MIMNLLLYLIRNDLLLSLFLTVISIQWSIATEETDETISKRRSVREFFDALMAGSTSSSSASSSSPSQSSTPTPSQPIRIAIPIPMPPPQMPQLIHGPPPGHGYGYQNSYHSPYHDDHHHGHHHSHHHGPHGHHHHHHHDHPHTHSHSHPSHTSHPPYSNYHGHVHRHPSHSQHGTTFPILIPSDLAPQHTHAHPIAIAIPVNLPFSFQPSPEDVLNAVSGGHRSKSQHYITNSDFGDAMSGSSRYAIFAEPLIADDADDLFSTQRVTWI